MPSKTKAAAANEKSAKNQSAKRRLMLNNFYEYRRVRSQFS